MARIKAERDIDYVIVYARSRLHRNSIDAAITKRDLRQAGAVLISVMDYTEDNAIGDLVATVLDGVNEYQSRSAGADISYKMGQKVIRGGSIGLAPIGYLNIREKYEGREVRTVIIDPVRGPLVRMAFELYATGTYGFHDLIAALTDAGLRTKPNKRSPAGKPISIAKLGVMLRSRYYLGYVTYKGVEYRGRHEPLISQELYDRVQEILDHQRGGGTRARTHHHYLKGTLWCQRCYRRLMIMRGKGKRGDLYFYYICRGRQDHTCDLPYLPIASVEAAVERHYETVSLSADLRVRINTAITAALADNTNLNENHRQRLKQQLAKLSRQEDQYLDLVGDPDWPRQKLAERLRRIRDERAHLEQQLDRTERPDLDAGRQALTAAMDLLTHPNKLYQQANERARRVLNQAIFTRLYVDADDEGPTVQQDEPTHPFAPLIATQRTIKQNGGVAARKGGDTAVSDERTASLLAAVQGRGSSKAELVEVAGIEPASFGDESGLLRAQPA
jgi:site-specific DNA recombinase